MASGPTVGEGGGGDGVREKQRYIESKVYTRKSFKGPRKVINNNTNAIVDVATVTASATTVTAVAKTAAVEDKDDDINSNNRIKESDTAPTITTATTSETDNVNNKINHDNDNNSAEPVPCIVVTEDRDRSSTPQQLISRFDAASDDSSCLNRQQITVETAVQSTWDQPSGNGVTETAVENQIENNSNLIENNSNPIENNSNRIENNSNQIENNSIQIENNSNQIENNSNQIENNAKSRFKQERRELRRKLENELETVRNVLQRIEAKQGQLLSESSHFHGSANEGMNKSSGEKWNPTEVAAVRVPREPARPLNQLSIPVLENSYVEKEKRTPKANQFYRNSEFILGKDRLPPAESNKKSKVNVKKSGGGEIAHGFGTGSKFFKSCSSLLEKLMKHKYGWVFDAPVDVEGLGLHDYYTIIQHPMDLGTVKSRLNKNWYKSPKEFAEDVRLTFHNAMTYNPKGQDVHLMAEQLLGIFEDRWVIIESDYNREMRFGLDYGAALTTPTSRKSRLPPPPPLDMRRILERSESNTYRLDSKNKPFGSTPSARTPAPKKPKAKDLHKRDMTYEEKQKLSSNLQNLPSEKLDAIVQIIKKRNAELFQEDEEVEVDIDSVDAETLWELDRFVTNYKKSLSKNKRKAELALQARADGERNIPQKAPVAVVVPNENKADENVVSSSLPLQGQGNSSRSSSSSGSSSDSGSSSSDSDSDSSSASGSDTGS